jgi:hypothetical protein
MDKDINELESELKAGAVLCDKLTDRCRELEQEIADLKDVPLMKEGE